VLTEGEERRVERMKEPTRPVEPMTAVDALQVFLSYFNRVLSFSGCVTVMSKDGMCCVEYESC